ncbi:MAG: UDP-N-acetylmuramoylalanyl-D-glutamyl-2,6-diaminopimelate--D-alanyl-D-alanine ligase [Hyphomicrobiales bacterium]|nr:UDP-N-acetylmuramoylalanyl-D-glutamyl-2,6-diaminopimelate--D-alanyl-D-alanine ligase [Hyphomicrobiales bacterium]
MSNNRLWTGLALVNHLGARLSGQLPAGVDGISIDTRSLEEGDLFFAIMGENSDGHDYVAAAFEAGAAAAVVDEAHADGLLGAGPLYVVNDVLASLESLGRAARSRTGADIIAVTGSAGKTSTKEALRVVLSKVAPTHASIASYNNHWGVPLSLARMPVSTRFGIFEIGMNHPGEITPLTAMVRPNVAIITTIAPVHLAAFSSVDEIAEAKAEIFSGMEPHGVAIINRDVPQFERLRALARESQATEFLSFGESEEAGARLLSISEEAGHSIVEASILDTFIRYRIGAPGRHMAVNSLAVLLAARAVGVELTDAAAALAGFHPPSGRGSRIELPVEGGTITVIDESYNANPASMRAAITLLGAAEPSAGGRRIVVLGDMLELGEQENQLHAGLADTVAGQEIDLVFAVGQRMKYLYDAVPRERQALWTQASADMREPLLDELRAGDVVMIKGSNGVRMAALVKAIEERFAQDNGLPEQEPVSE